MEYERLHPEHVAGLVLVDTTADLPGAFGHQVTILSRIRATAGTGQTPADSAPVGSDRPAFQRLLACYNALGPSTAQRHLLFDSDERQARHEAWDEQSGLLGRGGGEVLRAYIEEGCLDSVHPELMRPIESRGVLFAGRHSEAVGVERIASAARAWRVPVRWFEHSGHFIYADEPRAFAQAVIYFVEGR